MGIVLEPDTHSLAHCMLLRAYLIYSFLLLNDLFQLHLVFLLDAPQHISVNRFVRPWGVFGGVPALPAAVPFSELSLPVGSAFCHTAHSFCSNTRYCRRRKIARKTGQSYQNNNKQPHQHASAMFCLGLSRNQRMYCRKTTKHRMVRSRPVMDILLALGRALHCLRKQWPYLICFLEDGRLNRATTGRSAV